MTWEPVPYVTVEFIGNATTLIRYGDVTLLTDPNFLHRGQPAYLGHGLASRRLHYEEYTVMKSPPSDFLREARRLGLGERIVGCERGSRLLLAPRPAPPRVDRPGR